VPLGPRRHRAPGAHHAHTGCRGRIIETIARINAINVVGVDIGGATTDVFSVFGGVFNRTVSPTWA
jgi:hypothetical protein